MTNTRRLLGRTLMLGTVAALAACGEDTTEPEEFSDAMVIDAAMIAADATIEEVRMWGEPFLFGPLPGVAGPQASPARPGGRGSWSGTLEGTRSVTFYAEGGVEQDAYDAETTDSIHIEHSIAGTIERDHFTAEIARERSMSVSGLAGEETTRTWNGEGTHRMARSGVLEDGTERSHSMEGSAVYTDVVVPIPGTEPRYPLSGTIERTMLATRTTPEGTETREVHVIITFDGSQYASAVVNGEEIEIDLAAEDGRRPFRRKFRG